MTRKKQYRSRPFVAPPIAVFFALFCLACSRPARAAEPPPGAASAAQSAQAIQAATDEPVEGPEEYVEVTATRIPEKTVDVPASVTVVRGEDLRRRGARDLAGALALVSGVSIAPGGDGGPASSVPEMWGLREFDAFLLVVDGVPYGGAFNPALATLDLENVERIEVLRGPAPVMYGATSFTGVIHVIHREPGTGAATVEVGGGSYGSGRVSVSSPLPEWAGFHSTLVADAGKESYRDDRTSARRGHLDWRARRNLAGGTIDLNLDGLWQRQDPASPTPRVGTKLTSEVPIDANNNPGGAQINERRLTVGAGYERPAGPGKWTTTLSLSQSDQSVLRGFLNEDFNTLPNAHGFRQSIAQTDVFIDTHFTAPLHARLDLVAGLDHLYGRGTAGGGDFDYSVRLDGESPPAGDKLADAASIQVTDTREFSGLYAQLEWSASDRWRLTAGSRLNRTAERRETRGVEFGAGPVESGSDRQETLRGTGIAGATFKAWSRDKDLVTVYADFRNAFKPAAVDFGLDAEAELLSPETAHSYEGGVKSRLLGGLLALDLSVFQMDMSGLVVSTTGPGGLPRLENAGSQRMRGIELESAWEMTRELSWRTAYSLHDARFRNYLSDIGQLAGHRLEMSARDMASTGLVYRARSRIAASGVEDASGWQGYLQANWVGARWLNRRNTALAPDYATWSAGVGYLLSRGIEIRLDGRNLNDQRPPVSESELGESQYYRLPARRFDLTARWRWGGRTS